ncbi:hypothetical protein E8E14_012760 [Neopestalotiopsis sp. 37M]|nr:hypothetical protein E8E14_012760 [Neopestalotiopsis sp. 37M]
MASVSSLDKDLRMSRSARYTPAAANEAQSWIEGVLGEKLAGKDLLEGLKDGVALCKLVNLAIGAPGVKFKKSAMPFVQMENISHYLRACKSPPLSLPDHDMFLTVDLFERKDPAQVLQCLGAFSRAAQKANPSAFPTSIGGIGGGGNKQSVVSPESTGTPSRSRALSNVSQSSSSLSVRPAALVPHKTGSSTGSGRWGSNNKSPTSERVGSPSVSSWSKKFDEGVTSPAWNIAQYGYMGGASQGNLGVAFGARRQITSAAPSVPSAAEKERRRKQQEAEAERQRQQMQEEEQRRKAELEAEEERSRLAEEKRWEEETRKQRDEEKRKAEDEKRRWQEEERQWRLTNEKRRQEEEEAEARIVEERRKSQSHSRANSQLQGQFLSQYQAEQDISKPEAAGGGYAERIKALERELELARQREQQYEEERQRQQGSKNRNRSRSRPRLQDRTPSRQDSWSRDEREVLKTQWDRHQEEQAAGVQAPRLPSRPLPDPKVSSPLKPQRTGGNESLSAPPPTLPLRTQRTGEARPLPGTPEKPKPNPAIKSPGSSGRPLPTPASPNWANRSSRTDRFLASNPAPKSPPVQQTYSRELGAGAEQDAEDRRRTQSQAKTKAGGWAGKSLLEREMEMERQRQKEWEAAQEETANTPRSRDGVDGIGGGIGGRWDVGQWSGFTGGDNQNNVGTGIGAGRRQIVGPRPLPRIP